MQSSSEVIFYVTVVTAVSQVLYSVTISIYGMLIVNLYLFFFDSFYSSTVITSLY